jgi:beta-lactamase class A
MFVRLPIRIHRRDFIVLSVSLHKAGVARAQPDQIEQIERALGGRIGVSGLNTATGHEVRYRAEERFALCSTFKVPLAAAVLARVDRGELALDQTLSFSSADLLAQSPVTTQHVAAGELSVERLCAAAIEVSDNTAANLLLSALGGPPELTAFLRRIGDATTRLDRMELELNSNLPNDPRDTTTPEAMSGTLRTLLVEGRVLGVASRERVVNWMLNERNGRDRIRRGVPSDWRVANKPGTGKNGATNDVAIVWPSHGAPLVIVIYIDAPAVPFGKLTEAVARVADSVSSVLV